MSQIHFNSFSNNYNHWQTENKKQNQKTENNETVKQETNTQVSSEKTLNSLDVLGRQFLVQPKKEIVIPNITLSDDRIASIEDSMALFEEGVNKFADIINAEFGGTLSEKTVNELAANAMLAAM